MTLKVPNIPFIFQPYDYTVVNETNIAFFHAEHIFIVSWSSLYLFKPHSFGYFYVGHHIIRRANDDEYEG